jgi:hypothetical protein
VTSPQAPAAVPALVPGPPPTAFPRGEAALLAALLIAFVAVLAMTSLRVQPVWLDEVTVADPAVNLYFGKGFTSTGWQYQTKEEFWASNAPLHQVLLFHWIRLFGFTPLAVRSISFVFMALTIALLWFATWNLKLLVTPLGRMIFVALLIGGAGITFNYYLGRYDCIGILLLAAVMAVYSLEWPLWIKSMVLLVLGMLIPVAGVNLIPYTLVIGFLLILFLGPGFRREAACLAAGVVLGLLALYILYVTNGVEKVLLTSAGGHGLAGTLGDDAQEVRQAGLGPKVKYILTHLPSVLGRRFRDGLGWYFSDRSFVAVVLVLGVRALALRRAGKFSRRSVEAFGLAVAALVPLVLGVLRNYPFYYSWMAYLPVGLCAVHSCETFWRPPAWAEVRGKVTAAACGAAFLWASLQGLPFRLLDARTKPAPSHAALEAFVASGVTKSDRAYADFEAYYPMRRIVTYVLLPTYKKMMSDAEKKELTVLVLRRPNIREVEEMVGGRWAPVSNLELPEPYDLCILRRP